MHLAKANCHDVTAGISDVCALIRVFTGYCVDTCSFIFPEMPGDGFMGEAVFGRREPRGTDR